MVVDGPGPPAENESSETARLGQPRLAACTPHTGSRLLDPVGRPGRGGPSTPPPRRQPPRHQRLFQQAENAEETQSGEVKSGVNPSENRGSIPVTIGGIRSEERRVGKECRS